MYVFGILSCTSKVTTKGEAHWNLKAFNGRVVCAFLSHCAVSHYKERPSPASALLAACMPCPQIHVAIFSPDITSLLIPHFALMSLISPDKHLGLPTEFKLLWMPSQRSAGSQMQLQIEKAGRYLCLVPKMGGTTTF